jgi:uncharacterized protein with von Willebrand factor type A (vWA) domain
MDETLERFIRALRGSGVRISVSEYIDAVHTVELIGYGERDALRDALSAVLAKSLEEKEIFDNSFELFFSNAGLLNRKDGPANPTEAGENDSPLTRMLISEEASSLPIGIINAAQAVGISDIRFFTQKGRYTRSILQQMGWEQLNGDIQRLENEGASGSQSALNRLEEAREELIANVRTFVERQFNLFAQSATEEKIEEYLGDMPLSKVEERDFERMHGIIRRMVKRLHALHSRRRRASKRGQPDFKKTFRRNVAFQGIPFDRKWIAKKIDRPNVVVLCDVSRSVSTVVRFLLLFLYSLNEALVRIRSFALCSNIREVSQIFDACAVEEAVGRIQNGTGTGVSMGRTDYGQALHDFKENWPDTVTNKTTVIILGDARNNYGDPQVEVLESIYRRCKKLIWLNPENRARWGTGDSEMRRYLPFCHVAEECYTLRHLEKVVHSLLRTSYY